jgi:electron transport complex protein RnfD
MVGSVFVLSLLVGGDATTALYQILSGGLVFGAVFMATDYVTTPITRTGKMIFALGCGLITFLIRQYGGYPEGVSFAILFMNILTPYIESWTKPRALGKRGNK